MSAEIGRLLTAMITPFKSDGAVDYQAAEKLAAMLVADGFDGVVVSGTTGESPALSDDEKIELLKVIKKALPGKSVVAGTGSNDTHHSVKKMIDAFTKADTKTTMEIHQGLLPVIKTLMTTAANPVPIKSALNAMGFPAGPFRLPLVPLTDDQLKSVMQTIGEAGTLISFKAGVKVA